MSEQQEEASQPFWRRRIGGTRFTVRFVIVLLLMSAANDIASRWLDFGEVMAILGVIAVATLLYQRLVNKRSWRSILLGDPSR